jgi:hypothetical protein
MSRTEDNTAEGSRLTIVLGSAPPRYLTVAECSRIRIHPDDFLAWMDGDRAATAPSAPHITHRAAGRLGARKTPAPGGLRSLLMRRSAAA